MKVRVPVIVLVLAFTAIPTAFRSLNDIRLGRMLNPRIDAFDVIANVAAYIVVGFVLSDLRRWKGIGIAAAISAAAEVTQLFSWGRFPSSVDFVANVIGAAVGVGIGARLNLPPLTIPINKLTASIAVALAIAYLGVGAWAAMRQPYRNSLISSAFPANARGSTAPGKLEAHWKFDETNSGIALDASGNDLRGVYINAPARVDGVLGHAVQIDGKKQYVDFGNPPELRLNGSMTLMTWINVTAFPPDDSAIISKLGKTGYQLDTTVDRGPRTIGFKIEDSSRRLTARYGRTPIETGTWYHVAAVLDAPRATLDVYLDGRLDNGCLLGGITNDPHVSADNLYIGRRSDRGGYEFSGLIDDVRIYSQALTPREVGAVVAETISGAKAARKLPPREMTDYFRELGSSGSCQPTSARHAVVATGWMVGYGMLVAIALAGFRLNVSGLSLALVSLAAGVLLLPVTASLLLHTWTAPAFSCVGGISAAVSRKRSATDTPAAADR